MEYWVKDRWSVGEGSVEVGILCALQGDHCVAMVDIRLLAALVMGIRW